MMVADHLHCGAMSGSVGSLDMHARMRELRVAPPALMYRVPEPRPHELVVVRIDARALYMKSWSERLGVTNRVFSFPAALEALHRIAVCDLLSDPTGIEL